MREKESMYFANIKKKKKKRENVPNHSFALDILTSNILVSLGEET